MRETIKEWRDRGIDDMESKQELPMEAAFQKIAELRESEGE